MSRIAVYAGHGGSDSGAVGNGFKEKNITLAVMKSATAYLKKAGHTVINNRTTDVDTFIATRAAQANNAGVDAVVEIHLNSNKGTPATGAEVFCNISNSTGKKLAGEILNRIVALGFKSRGVKDNIYNFGIIRQTKATTVLVETAFINNAADMAKYNADKMGKAIAQGIMALFGGAVSAPAKPTAPAKPSNPYPVPTRNISRGAKGGDVKWVQKALVNKGYSVGKYGIDGACGNDTVSAIKKFQKKNSLVVDGIVGSKTRAKLLG